MQLIKNAQVYAPESLGLKDVLIGGSKILAIEDQIESHPQFEEWDAEGRIMTPGLIDQHIHIIGAGGKHGYSSMTPEILMTELVSCGTTTVVGLLGTDGSTRGIKTLYAKCKALDMEGMTAYMFTGYFGLEPMHVTSNVQEEMIFIDKVLGCKVAMSDVRSSFPTDLDFLRLLRQVRVGGMISAKKGILHIHLGALDTQIDALFRIVRDHQFPIENISPTHMGRTKDLFEQGIEFNKMGGMVDISTGGTKYTEPYKSLLYGLEKGGSINYFSFSSDGNAGLDRKNEKGELIGFRKAPFDLNIEQAVMLVKDGGLSITDAFKPVTINPAVNLGLNHKGRVAVGCDADLCCFDDDLNLTDVFAMGKQVLRSGELTVSNSF
jgi:beta-aspartyl-dipeptidase (metallo-type)